MLLRAATQKRLMIVSSLVKALRAAFKKQTRLSVFEEPCGREKGPEHHEYATKTSLETSYATH